MTCGSWEARTPQPAISLFSGGRVVSRVTCNVYNFKSFSSARDSNTGVTGLAHLDNDEPEDFLMLEREVWILDGG